MREDYPGNEKYGGDNLGEIRVYETALFVRVVMVMAMVAMFSHLFQVISIKQFFNVKFLRRAKLDDAKLMETFCTWSAKR